MCDKQPLGILRMQILQIKISHDGTLIQPMRTLIIDVAGSELLSLSGGRF